MFDTSSLGKLVITGCSGIFFTAIALVVGWSDPDTTTHNWAKLIGGAWALTAIVGSCELIYTHLKYYSVPAEQRQIVRILFMVPIYAVDSWVALWEPTLTEYIDPIRDCYEAYVLYCFIALLQAYLGDEEELLARLKGQYLEHLPPFCYNSRMELNAHFLRRCKQSVIQYMILRPCCVIFEMIARKENIYEGGIFNFKRGYAYVIFVTNISQTVAIYALVYMYLGLKHDPNLRDHSPLGKFMCIKAVVFFSFWQTCFFQVLLAAGMIQDGETYSAKEICAALSDFVLIFEMLIYSILHMYVFGYEPYRLRQAQGLWDTPWLRASDETPRAGSIYKGLSYSKRDMLTSALNQGDVAQDVWNHTPGIRPHHEEAVAAESDVNLAPDESSSASPTPLLMAGGGGPEDDTESAVPAAERRSIHGV